MTERATAGTAERDGTLEDALRASEQRFRTVINAGFDAFVIVRAIRDAQDAVTDLVIVDANDRAARLVDQSVDAILGKSLLDVFVYSRATELWDQCLRVLETRQPFDVVQFAPLPAQHDRWIERQLLPFEDGVAISSRDVTKRHLERLALEASEARHRALFDSTGAVQLVIDAESGTIVDVNPAAERFYGWPRAAMSSMLITDIDSITLAEWRAQSSPMSLGSGAHLRREHVLASGERRQVEAYKGLVEFGGRRLVHVIVQDVSDRARAESQLRESEARLREVENQLREAQKLEAIGQLAGGIAHDFNNALTVIRGSAGFLRDVVHGAAVEDLVSIERATDRAESLTQQLLAFARRQPLHLEQSDLTTLVRDYAATVRESLPVQIRMNFDLTTEPALVRIDRRRVLDALRVLVDNARNAMPDGGVLTLGTRAVSRTPTRRSGREGTARTFIELFVRDTGGGMRDDVQAHLFEPFFSTQPFGTGRGMSLPAVHGMMAQSGGTITCESAVGSGTTFVLAFPV